MDFELSDDQRAILEAIEALLKRHAGPERAIELAAKGAYDKELGAALGESGFLDLARGEETGPLEAALMVEAVARAGGCVSVGARAFVAPLVLEGEVHGPVALAVAGSDAPVRFAAHARTLLVLDAYTARRVDLVPGDVEPVRSNFGYPLGRVGEEILAGGASLGRGSGARLRNAWRTALAVEMAGTLRAALDVTVDYVKKRRQFGRAIGSFQGVQHRLAHAQVLVEGARWLALEAAWQRCPEEGAALAAAHASTTAHRVFAETHQFSGAMGFTHEHDLHVWSMRLQALRLELDGAAGHQRAAAVARWVRE